MAASSATALAWLRSDARADMRADLVEAGYRLCSPSKAACFDLIASKHPQANLSEGGCSWVSRLHIRGGWIMVWTVWEACIAGVVVGLAAAMPPAESSQTPQLVSGPPLAPTAADDHTEASH